MGILVQREFTVAGDHRQEFERQSRLGVWADMRHNGAQMIAFGSWAFGGQADVVITHSGLCGLRSLDRNAKLGRVRNRS